MKRFKSIFILALPMTALVIVIQSLSHGTINWMIITSGVFAGLFFGIFFLAGFPFVKQFSHYLASKIIIKLEQDEALIREGGASHFKRKEAVGGKLLLTNKRLLFKSHKLNFQNHEQVFLIRSIKEVKESKKNFIFEIELMNGRVHRFIVDSPGDWIRSIKNTSVHN